MTAQQLCDLSQQFGVSGPAFPTVQFLKTTWTKPPSPCAGKDSIPSCCDGDIKAQSSHCACSVGLIKHLLNPGEAGEVTPTRGWGGERCTHHAGAMPSPTVLAAERGQAPSRHCLGLPSVRPSSSPLIWAPRGLWSPVQGLGGPRLSTVID